MSRFEYKILREDIESVEATLTEEGMQGWQVIRVEKSEFIDETGDEEEFHVIYIVWFMREFTPPPLIVNN